jgi:hypothetical protein
VTDRDALRPVLTPVVALMRAIPRAQARAVRLAPAAVRVRAREDADRHPGRVVGRVRFIVFYLVCGVAAALAQALPDPGSTIPMIGASGAISGVLGAYLLLYPHARVLVAVPFGFYIHTMMIKAGWVLGFWFVFQLISSVLTAAPRAAASPGARISAASWPA